MKPKRYPYSGKIKKENIVLRLDPEKIAQDIKINTDRISILNRMKGI